MKAAWRMMLQALVITCLSVPCIALAADAVESGPRDLPCEDPASALRQGLFELGVGSVRLSDGQACLKYFDEQSGCEWDVALTRVDTFGPDGRFLLVVLNANHIQGSGAWDSVLVYVCRRDMYLQKFSERYLYGAKVQVGVDSDFWVTAGYWRQNDPTCCPSRERRRHHVWNARRQRFVIGATEVRELR